MVGPLRRGWPLGILLAVAAPAGCSDDGGGPPAATTTTVRRTSAQEAPLTSGDCGNVPRLQVGGALDPASVETVPCTEAHNVEIGPVIEYPAGAELDFPGTESVDGYANQQCLERFEPYVGTPYLESGFDYLIVAPDEDGWIDGDRRIACILYQVDFAVLTAPAANSGI